MSLANAWQRILTSMTTVQSSRERIARTTSDGIDPGQTVDTGVISIGELLVLGEAVRILARVQFESPQALGASEAAGLGCSTIQMLLDDLIQNTDSMVLAAH